MLPIDLSERTAIVTGGGQGLGAAISQILHQAGANIVVNYFSDPQGVNLQRAEQTVEAFGDRAVAIEADVRNPEQILKMFQDTQTQFGAVDIVVNNAGILRDHSIKKMSRDEWDTVIDTNLTGVFNVCKEAALSMADNGRIINLASIAGVIGLFGQSNYSAAKAGVIGLTKVLSKELAKRNINVNAVAPGVILTEMGRTIPDHVRVEMIKNIPLARFGEPEEVASVVLFLASDLASYITGQVININGGWVG